ncbi:ETX/MTX2 family pore-forming toxin [Spiroplasma endosymbiont of Tipula paludosa]|uniref:ETX/MTX2 family pore-forming toxin n=1 Tax=Spiroplasma endosymbiont of Tipula paludosa TaxID=3066295 RepID=UPI0035C8F705
MAINNEINYQQTNNVEALSRVKRSPNDGDGNDLSASSENMYFHFKPNLWEEIIIEKYRVGNNFENFKEKFKDILKDYYYNKNDIGEWDRRVTYYYVDKFAEGLWNNWSTVISKWRECSKRERIRIIINWNGGFTSVNIITEDTNFYENKYLNKQIINEALLNTNLSEIYESKETNILDAIKIKNPNIDISHLSVSDITNKSAKITVNLTGKYSPGSWVVVYFVIPDLFNDFKKCLNPVDNINDETILAAAKQANPDLDITQIYVKEKVPNGKLTIAVKADSNKYSIDSYVFCSNFKVRQDLNEIITNTDLNIINNNNNAILNELNYLNLNLDISQLEVVEKTNISVTIQARKDSDKYFGEKKIWYIINNQENKIINLNELIKKGIFLSYRDKNQGITIKEIKNINSGNLIYSNVTATKSIEPIYNQNSKNICFGTTTLFHNLPEKQKMKTPNCKYTKETTVSSQITTGLSKTEGEEKSSEQSSSSDMKHNWNFELGISTTAEANVWPFAGVSATIDKKLGIGGEYGSSNTNTSSETKTLSNTFDFSSNKTNEYKEVSEVELPSQEIEVNPNQKIKVTASLDEVLGQITLKLTQNIYGNITSQITNTSNEEKSFEILIKEIMQKLKEYNLLPQEITINNDDSITFNGSAHRSLKQGFDGNIEFHEVK